MKQQLKLRPFLLLTTSLAMLMTLTGCASGSGLSINWDFKMESTYRSEVPIGDRTK